MAGYAEFYNQYDVAVRHGADIATQNGLAYMRELFPHVVALFVIAMCIAGVSNRLTMDQFVRYGTRMAFVIWLLVGAAYVPYVRDLFVDDIPNSSARAVSGVVDDRMTVVDQFQLIDDAAANYVAQVNQVATGITQIGNKIAAWAARGMQKVFLFFVFVVWIVMRDLAYLSSAVGVFMLLFFPFDGLKHITSSHFTKLFGIAMWQVSASVLLKIMLGGVQIYLKRVSTVGLTLSIDQQVDQCLDIAVFFMGMALLFIMIPATVGIGAASAASSSVASGAMMAIGGNLARAGNSIQMAGRNLNNAVRRMSRSTNQ